MKVHLAIGQYEFIEEEVETAEDALIFRNDVQQAFWKGDGIGLKALAKVIHEYCTTGGIEDGGNYDFSEKENLLIAEVKKIIRKNA